jgi:hypothetical protein
MPRRYTAKQRAQAAGIAVVEGPTVAAEQTGIPRKTIEYWMDKPEFAELRHKSRESVADEMWSGIQIGLREVVKGLTGEAPLRDKSVALGILYDKHALLTGGATGRMESRELNDLPDSTYVDAIRAARDIARSGGTGTDASLETESAG